MKIVERKRKYVVYNNVGYIVILTTDLRLARAVIERHKTHATIR